MEWGERGGAGESRGGPFLLQGVTAAWRHSAATVATVDDEASVLPAQLNR